LPDRETATDGGTRHRARRVGRIRTNGQVAPHSSGALAVGVRPFGTNSGADERVGARAAAAQCGRGRPPAPADGEGDSLFVP
jgi:hypothetical protein